MQSSPFQFFAPNTKKNKSNVRLTDLGVIQYGKRSPSRFQFVIPQRATRDYKWTVERGIEVYIGNKGMLSSLLHHDLHTE